MDKVEKGLGRRMSKDKIQAQGILKAGVNILFLYVLLICVRYVKCVNPKKKRNNKNEK